MYFYSGFVNYIPLTDLKLKKVCNYDKWLRYESFDEKNEKVNFK